MKKILLIDDDPDILRMLNNALKAQNYDVTVMEDALYATRTVFEQKPDLIILDVKIPAGGGVSVFERVKRMNSIAHIPVIFITGLLDEAMKKQLLDAGAVDFISKPFKIEDLLQKIKKFLSRILSRSKRPAPIQTKPPLLQ